MNTQIMFDLVCNHMILQGNRWGNFFNRCRDWSYINPNNDCERCVKGLFIDKERSLVLFRQDKFISWKDLVEDGIGRKLTNNEIFLLNEAESIFESTPYEDWIRKLKQLAKILKLNYNIFTKKEGKFNYEPCDQKICS